MLQCLHNSVQICNESNLWKGLFRMNSDNLVEMLLVPWKQWSVTLCLLHLATGLLGKKESFILFFRKVAIWIGELNIYFGGVQTFFFSFFTGVLSWFINLFGTLNIHLFLAFPELKLIHSPLWKASVTLKILLQKCFSFAWSLISKMGLSLCLCWGIYPWIKETRSVCRKGNFFKIFHDLSFFVT